MLQVRGRSAGTGPWQLGAIEQLTIGISMSICHIDYLDPSDRTSPSPRPFLNGPGVVLSSIDKTFNFLI
jgi:hypothetical protein